MHAETHPPFDRARPILLHHSQSTSARTLFLRHATGSVIAPKPPLY